MKFAILALAALTTTAVTQGSLSYDLESDPFRLILKSTDRRLDGHALGACHQGAAIEGLCLTNDTLTTPARPYTTFYHNVSSQSGNTVNADNTLGVLGWHLTLGALRVPSAMNFDYDPGSNLATPVIMPGQSRYEPVAFEAGTNHMYIPVKQNDQVSPPEPYLPPLKLKNWFNCLTRYSYTYETLAWKVGMTGEPQNPTCTAVEVHRVWV